MVLPRARAALQCRAAVTPARVPPWRVLPVAARYARRSAAAAPPISLPRPAARRTASPSSCPREAGHASSSSRLRHPAPAAPAPLRMARCTKTSRLRLSQRCTRMVARPLTRTLPKLAQSLTWLTCQSADNVLIGNTSCSPDMLPHLPDPVNITIALESALGTSAMIALPVHIYTCLFTAKDLLL